MIWLNAACRACGSDFRVRPASRAACPDCGSFDVATWADDAGQEALFGQADYRRAMNFGMIWDSPDKPSVEDAIAKVRSRAAADGTVIPEGVEPKIVRHDPSPDNRYGSLHVIFEWEEQSSE